MNIRFNIVVLVPVLFLTACNSTYNSDFFDEKSRKYVERSPSPFNWWQASDGKKYRVSYIWQIVTYRNNEKLHKIVFRDISVEPELAAKATPRINAAAREYSLRNICKPPNSQIVFRMNGKEVLFLPASITWTYEFVCK